MNFLSHTKFAFALIPLFAFNSAIALEQVHPEDNNLKSCLKIAYENAPKAIAYATDWHARFGGKDARYCLGIAYIENEDFERGAKILSDVAKQIPKPAHERKILILSQAANGYLLAHLDDLAKVEIDQAIEIDDKNADLYIDRARIFAMQKLWKDAENDLTKAMALRGEIPLALRLRAEARLQQQKYTEAENDLTKAINIDPKDNENYFIRGRVREAKRLGHAPD